MTRRARIAAVVVVAALVEFSMSATGMAPSLPLVASLVALVAAIAFLVHDLQRAVLAVRWEGPVGATPPATGRDMRVNVLRMRLAASDRHGSTARQLYASLVELIDDHLLGVHGIDRAEDPDAAEAVLGPELNRFVASGQPPARLTSVRVLRGIVQRIEQL
jgi:hypothetical protein